MLSSVNELSVRLSMIDKLRQGLSVEAKHSSRDAVFYFDWLKSEVCRALASEQLVVQTPEEGSGLVKLVIEASNQQIFNK
jgi:hypothetical protein